jgi:hypothetical protein
MKKLMIASLMLFISIAGKAQTVKKISIQKGGAGKTTTAKNVKTTKYNDNIDDRMKGPNGEVVYIGTSGGRFYMKNNKKVYVEYKGNKKK